MSTPAGWYQDPTNAASCSTGTARHWTGQTSPAAAQAARGMGSGTGAGRAATPLRRTRAATASPARRCRRRSPTRPTPTTGRVSGGYFLDFLFIVVTIGIGWIVNWFLIAREGERNGQTSASR